MIGYDLASQLIAHANGERVLTGRAEQVVDALREAGLTIARVDPPDDLMDVVTELEDDKIECVEWRDRRRYARVLRAHSRQAEGEQP